MKKLLLTLFIACFSVVFASAQDAPKPKSFVFNKTNLTEAGCDAEQIKKITAIRKDAAKKRKEIDADANLDDKAKKAAIKALTKERNEAQGLILNDAQKAKIKEMDAKFKADYKAAAAAIN